jgi:hypothetical protein
VSNARVWASITSAEFDWTTNQKAVGVVEYGEGPDLGMTSEATKSGTRHSVKLPRLGPFNTYFYRIKVTDPTCGTVYYPSMDQPPLYFKTRL